MATSAFLGDDFATFQLGDNNPETFFPPNATFSGELYTGGTPGLTRNLTLTGDPLITAAITPGGPSSVLQITSDGVAGPSTTVLTYNSFGSAPVTLDGESTFTFSSTSFSGGFVSVSLTVNVTTAAGSVANLVPVPVIIATTSTTVTVPAPSTLGSVITAIQVTIDVEFLTASPFAVNFPTFNMVTACLLTGTRIAVPLGSIPVEDVRIGTEVMLQQMGAPGDAALPKPRVSRALGAPSMRLSTYGGSIVHISAGALGAGVPERSVVITGNHPILYDNAHRDAATLVGVVVGVRFVDSSERDALEASATTSLSLHAIQCEHEGALVIEGGMLAHCVPPTSCGHPPPPSFTHRAYDHLPVTNLLAVNDGREWHQDTGVILVHSQDSGMWVPRADLA